MYVDLSIILSCALSKIPTIQDILKNGKSRITFMWLVWSGLWPMVWSVDIYNKFPCAADAADQGTSL